MKYLLAGTVQLIHYINLYIIKAISKNDNLHNNNDDIINDTRNSTDSFDNNHTSNNN